jgi:quercetin dioxygenase-like cupin family protein
LWHGRRLVLLNGSGDVNDELPLLRGGPVADASPARYDPGAMEEMATSRATGVAQVFDLHALKAFAPDKRVRKMLFKTDQLWSEIACYEPGQSTVMHTHPKEEEAIFVLEGTAHMSIDGDEVVVEAGSIVKFPRSVMHDVRNLGPERCVIMFLKVNPKVLSGPRVLSAKADG